MPGYLWPFVLLGASILLICVETFVPSAGILGILAGICLLGAIITAFLNVGAVGGSLFLMLCAALTPAMVYTLIRIWPKTPIGKRILMQRPSESQVVPQRQHAMKQLIGKTGVAVSSMIPSGAIRLEGRLLDAVTAGMAIEKDTLVEIVAVRGNHLVVRPAGKQKGLPDGADAKSVLDQPVERIVSDPFEDPLA